MRDKEMSAGGLRAREKTLVLDKGLTHKEMRTGGLRGREKIWVLDEF
jgi:hypothetical protein